MKIKNEFHFSKGTLLKDINESNVIKAFKDRIEKWYFEPINILNNKEFGFAATTLLASFIDILAKTENHDHDNKNNRSKYTKWIVDKFNFTKDEALDFYNYFRCGLLHAGCIESGGYISYNEKNFYLNYKGSLIINPRLLFKKIEHIFKEFIDKESPELLFSYLKGKLNEIR